MNSNNEQYTQKELLQLGAIYFLSFLAFGAEELFGGMAHSMGR